MKLYWIEVSDKDNKCSFGVFTERGLTVPLALIARGVAPVPNEPVQVNWFTLGGGDIAHFLVYEMCTNVFYQKEG